MDDYHIEAPIHCCAIVLPAIFAASEQESTPFDGSSFHLAAVVGFETGPRVGLGLWGAHMLSLGWHSGAIFGPSAAAAAVSKLFRLPADTIEDALGMACTQAGGLMSAQFGSRVKRMQHGFAVRNRLLAAYLAREGYTGIKEIFDLEYGGFLSTFSLGLQQEPRFVP
jgi:aconitate decarboxylase